MSAQMQDILPDWLQPLPPRRKRRLGAALILGSAIFVTSFMGTFVLGNTANKGRAFWGSMAIAGTDEGITVPLTKPGYVQEVPEAVLPVDAEPPVMEDPELDESYIVQAVLSAKRQVVLASGIDAKIVKLKLESGDRFKKGEMLVEYDCSVDYGRLSEAESRQRVTEKQLAAYEKLVGLESASQMELTIARENNEQNKALIEQIKGRLKACRHIAPWDGRVTRKMASQYEYVQTGRVLMEISSLEPLRAEFLIPSKWLRWLNIGTPLKISIGETGRTYEAKIVSIHGEVDPVSQSIQIVAEMEEYHEELLPGMSGRATFAANTVRNNGGNGFLGLMALPNGVGEAP